MPLDATAASVAGGDAVRLSNNDIANMGEELIAGGHVAADEKWALCLHPINAGEPTIPPRAEVYLSRCVPVGFCYALTLQQARENCPPYVDPKAAEPDAGKG